MPAQQWLPPTPEEEALQQTDYTPWDLLEMIINPPKIAKGMVGLAANPKGWMKAGSKSKDFISRVLLEGEDRVWGSAEKAVSEGIKKPHGFYYSWGAQNPHYEKGKKVVKNYINKDANILDVGEEKVKHTRFSWTRGDEAREGFPSAGVAALKKLTSEDEFAVLSSMGKKELKEYIAIKYPDIQGLDKYFDNYELLEVLGARKARELGFDAIRQTTKNRDMDEFVALTEKAIK